jgi:hypothetical protein
MVVIRKSPGEVEILFDDDDGDAQLHPHTAQGIFDLLHDIGLDAFGGLVQEQEFWLPGQRAADGELLLLAAG